MDWIPTLKPSAMALSDSHDAPPGRLLYIRRSGLTRAYLTFGQDGRTTHWLDTDAEGGFRVVNPAQVHAVKALVFDVSNTLKVAVRHGQPDPDQMVSNYGCIGLTTLGPVLCVRERQVNFGGDAPVYLGLPTWRPLIPDHQGWFNDIMWFSRWDLFHQVDEAEERHKILGSPDWDAPA